jgi:hypothetical protein
MESGGSFSIQRINQNNLTLNGSLASSSIVIFNCEINSNSSFTISNLNPNTIYLVRIYSSGSYSVSLPISGQDVIRKSNTTISMALADYIDISIDFDGNKRFWQVSELIANN